MSSEQDNLVFALKEGRIKDDAQGQYHESASNSNLWKSTWRMLPTARES